MICRDGFVTWAPNVNILKGKSGILRGNKEPKIKLKQKKVTEHKVGVISVFLISHKSNHCFMKKKCNYEYRLNMEEYPSADIYCMLRIA